jgi:hypothetical protein
VPEWQRRQWDVASFVAASSALTLSTYNTVQISKLETAIEAQKQKTDLLTDIVKIHEQHLHQLDRMIDDIGREIQVLKVQSGLHFSIDKAIAQVISDTNKLRAVVAIFERVIHSAFDQKLAPRALSVDVLETILHHIKDMAASNKFHNFIHQPSDLYIDSTKEKIFSLGNNTWVVYSIGTIATNQVCPRAGTLSPMTIKSGQTVTVTQG